jgi:hypothetical protein
VKPLNADGSNKYQDNGYFGAVDPTPYMFDDFARDVNTLPMAIEKAAAILQAVVDRMRAVRTSA